MLRTLVVIQCLIITSLFISISSANASSYPRCNCEDESTLLSVENILEIQRVSDFLIAVAYFSIPIELLYFVSCSNVPFKWVLFQFIAFIVLCGMTHLLNGWTYDPHPFRLMLALTIFKILTALVSCATAITLFTLIPLLLKVKVRELMLKKKARDLGREVGIIMRQNETGLHVRMLTQEIRKSLDRHTILHTTLVELSKTLGLQNCAVWMPNEENSEMILTHELKGRSGYSNGYGRSIRMDDQDVEKVTERAEVNVLRPDSSLAIASCGENPDMGPVAAIRMPMLSVSNFKGGTPELIQTCYAVLVCVLPNGGNPRDWSDQELDIVKVVADQVAVAVSHAAVLEDSQLMREKLAEQNRKLLLAKQNATRASQARMAFRKAMSDGMRRPMHSVLGLLSMLQDENLTNEQNLIVDAMVKTGNVLSDLINDMMDGSRRVESGRYLTETRPFRLHSMVREATCLAKCLCVYYGFGFTVEAEKSLPDNVVGDEKRIFQVIFHMFGSLFKGRRGVGGCVVFRVFRDRGSCDRNDQRWAAWRQTSSDGEEVFVRFEIGIEIAGSSVSQPGETAYESDRVDEDLSFGVCKKLVQSMQGNIRIVANPDGSRQTMSLLLRFKIRPSISITIPEPGESPDQSPPSNSLFRGMCVLLADSDDLNRAVTRKLLEKLGCIVTAVSSGFHCLTAIGPVSSSFQVVIVDLHMPEMDGYDVAMRIRKFGSRSWPLIVAITGSADEDLWEKCTQVGINGVIRKPVVLQEIAGELRRVLLQINKSI